MPTPNSHHLTLSQTVNGLRLTLQVDVSVDDFEIEVSGETRLPIELSALDRAGLLAQAGVEVLASAHRQLHQSLFQSWRALVEKELESIGLKNNKPACDRCGDTRRTRIPYSSEFGPCEECGASQGDAP